ncbi:hypothetical protein DICPUDRAFT_148800 [Dictyostelium purpureum]|uniref:Uncharacterized protein n=1 Tax=Dictyostelium purpureum TaxID=5786 RepID=F0ZC13_DICPU|nr:uncharacterized protein DICPUDRAFT_148800 [Dictyostelium purpureum]EGC38514.1 hypothetical protein DICPUDRAFT_148800 [Dictyostelium purpureum]|eukprot:XP_003284979.1 hypothetical protein DICPUDRAFT_148800 [Dictyostelium purpureum]
MEPKNIINKRNKSVAVIGIGFRLPGNSNNPVALWNNLINKFDGIVDTSERWSDNFHLNNEIKSNQAGLISLDEIKQFDPLMFSISPSDCDTIDPQQRLLLKCVWESLEDAHIDPIKLRGTNTSVYVGVSTTDYQNNLKNSDTFTNIFGSTNHSASNRISYCYDFKGQSLSIDTACSSSSNAIALGYESIVEGKSNYSIVGGASLLLDPSISKSFSHLNMLGKSGRCKSFDATADGYVRGEGVAVVVLKNLEQAINDGDRVYCVINGANSNADGNCDKNNFYSPSKTGQFNNIKTMFGLCSSQVTESDIDFVECHGTGTPTGDPIEVEAISMAFKQYHNQQNPLLIGTIKSNIGHLEACSGIASLIKCCLMFKHRQFVPNINFNEPNPAIKFDEWNLKVVTEIVPFPSNKKVSMMINNFGITSSNVCIVVSEICQMDASSIYQLEADKQYLVPFSANSKQSLNFYISNIQNDYNSLSRSCEFFDFVQYHIFSKSTKLYQKSIALANKWSDIKNNDSFIKTSDSAASNLISAEKIDKNTNICFIFSGQGTQWNGMGEQLYINDSYFKSTIDLIDSKLNKYYGYSILEKLRSTNDDTINHPIIAQPSVCMIQIALFETLTKQWNINPNYIIGHSLGELTSQYCSGSIDLDTLCYILYHRSIAQQKTIGSGRMLSINISSDHFNDQFSTEYPTIEISCYNSTNSIVIGGNEDQLKEIESKLKHQNIHTAFLNTPSSFHTSSQDKVKKDLIDLKFESFKPKTPVLSTIYQDFFNGQDKQFNSEYCFRNIREPVYFTQTIQKLYQHIESNQSCKNLIFIELSPHSALAYHLKQIQPLSTQPIQSTVLTTLNKTKEDINQIFQLISTLYCNHNYSINFINQLKTINNNNQTSLQYKHKDLNLPRYQWDDKIFWREDLNHSQSRLNGSPIEVLGNKNTTSPFITYKTTIDVEKPQFQYLKGHQVKGKYYFPGCGYIENIINSFPNEDLIISHLEFKVPLIFIEGVNKQLQTNIYQTSKKDYRAQFHYYEPNTNKWILSSCGNFQTFRFTNANEKKLDIEHLKTKCNLTKLNSQEFYNHSRVKAGISYSGFFQMVQQCYIGDNCILNHIPYKKVHDIVETIISCATLDCCVHGSMGLVDKNCQLVFDKVENLKFYSSNLPKDYTLDFYSFIELKGKKGDSYEFSTSIMLQDGTVFAEIERLVMTSTVQIEDSLKIQYPLNEFQTTFLQLKDCEAVTNLELLNHKDFNIEYKFGLDSYYNFVSSILFHHIKIKFSDIKLEDIKHNTIQVLRDRYLTNQKHSRLFNFAFETIKEYYQQEYIESEWNEEKLIFCNILTKSTKIMVDLLFPFGDKDKLETPSSLYDNGLLEQFYASSHCTISDILLSEIVKESIEPLIKKKNVIRILEFGGGVGSLSVVILNKINQLLKENESSDIEIEIEYTFSDISPTFIPYAKEKLSFFGDYNRKILFKSLSLEDHLISNQQLKPNYYDFVVMSNVLHVLKKISFGLNEIHQILKHNGYLMFVEPIYKSIVADSIFSVFDQWWSFEDTELRADRCCMTEDQWYKILSENNFKNIKFSQNNGISNILIHSQKQESKSFINTTNNDIIVYSDINNNNNQSFINNLIKDQQKQVVINTMEQFNNISKDINQDTIIYFTKTINQLNINNFKQITLEYIQIVQYLLKNKLTSTKLVLITGNCHSSQSSNYLASSVTGSFKYFLDQFEPYLLFSIDFDDKSLLNESNYQLINQLIDIHNNIQREYFIRNNQVYLERIKDSHNVLKKYTSNSIEQPSTTNNLKSILNENLEFQLESKKQLGENQVEVQVQAIGINYKDYLVYTRNVPPELINHNSDIHTPEFGLEYSGIVKSVGNNVDNFKVGDQVFSIHYNSSSSSIIAEKTQLSHKPNNISFAEAASIPAVYLTSYHSIFKVGNYSFKSQESILIHSATGGVGLSAIELLKWKGFKSHLFVTVGSEEKEKYLRDRYGSLITGIYSTRNKDYVQQIKQKLKELGSNKQGVDVILNTLPAEYLESNFKCLNKGGRIVDLSITHLNPNEFIDFNKFKYNYTYSNVELLLLDFEYINEILKKISKGISNGSLSLIPITEYSVLNIKEAFEYINQRKHIGKIVVNYDKDITSHLLQNKDEGTRETDQPIIKSNYTISSELGKTILITGQSGIALEIIKWISKYSKSVENIIILSKSTLKWELELLINKSKSNSNKAINYYFKSVDVEYQDQIETAINNIFNEHPSTNNIDSIFHFAFAYDACNPLEIDMKSLEVSHGAKTIGAINLHELSLKYKWNVNNFILASSIAAIYGSFNQCTYVCANNVLDSLAKYRKSLGLSALSVNWGHIGTTGIVSRTESVGELLDGIGIESMSANILLGALDLFIQTPNKTVIQQDYDNIIVNKLNYEKMPPSNLYNHKSDYILNSINRNSKLSNGVMDENTIIQKVISKIAELLSMNESNINKSIPLIEFGVDSIFSVQVKNWIDKEFKKNLFSISELQNCSINQIIKKLIDNN